MVATRSLSAAAWWSRRSRRRQDQWLGVLLVLPAVLFVVIFVLGPLFSTIVLSFYSRHLTAPNQPSTFVGLRNYRYIFGQGVVQPALLNSVFISAATVLIQFLLGLAIALLLNRQFAGRGAVRATFIMAWGVPTIAAAFVFRWLFDATYGAINKLLLSLHVISAGVPWLGEAHHGQYVERAPVPGPDFPGRPTAHSTGNPRCRPHRWSGVVAGVPHGNHAPAAFRDHHFRRAAIYLELQCV